MGLHYLSHSFERTRGNQFFEVAQKRADRVSILQEDTQLHVPIKGVIGKIGAAHQRYIIDHRALRMELPRPASLVAFSLCQRPVEQLGTRLG